MDGQASVREMIPTPRPPARSVEVPPRARRRQFTAAYKQNILEEADRCTEAGEIGALLRREGLYSSHLSKWRQQRDAAVKSALDQKRGRKPVDPLNGEVNRLRRENVRLKLNLERAERVIEVQGKVSALLAELSLGSAAEKPTRLWHKVNTALYRKHKGRRYRSWAQQARDYWIPYSRSDSPADRWRRGLGVGVWLDGSRARACLLAPPTHTPWQPIRPFGRYDPYDAQNREVLLAHRAAKHAAHARPLGPTHAG